MDESIVGSRPAISATVIAHNDEDKLPDCLRSLLWVDEIVVLDSGSSDATRRIAAEFDAAVHERPWSGFGQQKNAAASLASHDWILNVDADERVSPLLRRAIEGCGFAANAYIFQRISIFMGRQIRSVNRTGRDMQLRLYDRRVAAFNEVPVHEKVQAPTAAVELPGLLIHDFFRSMDNHVGRFQRYSKLAAGTDSGDGSHVWRLLVAPPRRLAWGLIVRGGWRDGTRGLIYSSIWAWHDFLIEAHRYEADLRRRGLLPTSIPAEAVEATERTQSQPECPRRRRPMRS